MHAVLWATVLAEHLGKSIKNPIGDAIPLGGLNKAILVFNTKNSDVNHLINKISVLAIQVKCVAKILFR